jgi:hypothetical protein
VSPTLTSYLRTQTINMCFEVVSITLHSAADRTVEISQKPFVNVGGEQFR